VAGSLALRAAELVACRLRLLSVWLVSASTRDIRQWKSLWGISGEDQSRQMRALRLETGSKT
jgi:hypothetical protein